MREKPFLHCRSRLWQQQSASSVHVALVLAGAGLLCEVEHDIVIRTSCCAADSDACIRSSLCDVCSTWLLERCGQRIRPFVLVMARAYCLEAAPAL